jgi:flagellar L-ring protein precursor FlgH
MFGRHKWWLNFLIHPALIGFTVFTLIGCVSNLKGLQPSEKIEPAIDAPVLPDDPVSVSQRVSHEGSLWQEAGSLSALFIDKKARRIGDIVTIKIIESSSASNKASTETARDSSLLAQIVAFFGLERKYNDPTYPGFNPDRLFNPFSAVQGGIESDFEGSGETFRSGDLTAYITARVTDIMPNGNLKIEGSREVEVNNEKQIITLSGTVRTIDISSDNIILSTYISDARITYSGSGVIDDRQRPGWMANILNKIWPF